jgi:hypothetical protein
VAMVRCAVVSGAVFYQEKEKKEKSINDLIRASDKQSSLANTQQRPIGREYITPARRRHQFTWINQVTDS